MPRSLRRVWASLLAALAVVASAATAQDFQFKTAITTVAADDRMLSDIASAGDRLVAVGERGLIVWSADNGTSWQQSNVPVSATLTAVSFPTPEAGWAVGHAGVILHSSDGGMNWSIQFDGKQANEQWLAYTREARASLAAEIADLEAAGDPDGLLPDLEFALEDADFNIEDAEIAIETGPADPLLDVLFTSSTSGWAVGAYGMIYNTVDGGETWTLMADRVNNPDRYHYYAIAQDNSGTLYLSGEAGLLYHSPDAGATWVRHEDVYIGSLFGLATRGQSVYTFGLRGNIFRSDDQGATWTSLANPTSFSLYGGSRLDDGNILLVGAGGGTLLIGADNSLQTGTQPSRATLSGVAQPQGGETIIVGMEGAEVYAGTTGEQL